MNYERQPLWTIAASQLKANIKSRTTTVCLYCVIVKSFCSEPLLVRWWWVCNVCNLITSEYNEVITLILKLIFKINLHNTADDLRRRIRIAQRQTGPTANVDEGVGRRCPAAVVISRPAVRTRLYQLFGIQRHGGDLLLLASSWS